MRQQLAAALTKNGLPKLDSLTDDGLVSALSSVSADGLRPDKKGMITLPQCFGKDPRKHTCLSYSLCSSLMVSVVEVQESTRHRSAVRLPAPPDPTLKTTCTGRTGGKALGGMFVNLNFAPTLVLDDEKCMLNGLLSLLPEAENSNSAYTDMVVGPIAWAKFMLQTFGVTSCSVSHQVQRAIKCRGLTGALDGLSHSTLDR